LATVRDGSSEWTVGEDGRRHPPRTSPDGSSLGLPSPSRAQLIGPAALINSGEVAREIARAVDDPDVTV
jgi:hypothetical protein